MDTFKDKQRLDDLNAQGDCPWEVWRHDPAGRATGLSVTGIGGNGRP
jgi:hypothetical protein